MTCLFCDVQRVAVAVEAALKGFFWPRTKYPSEEAMAEQASRIARALPP
ncbi:MAG: hypothetical protein ABIP89_16840 [Polyangiaceae bacterium]